MKKRQSILTLKMSQNRRTVTLFNASPAEVASKKDVKV